MMKTVPQICHIFVALASVLWLGAVGQDCYITAPNLMPWLLSYEGTSTTGQERFTAIAGNSDFLIVGGTTNRGALATHSQGNTDLPLIYRIDLTGEVRYYKWGKVIETVPGTLADEHAVKVESIALSPDLGGSDGYLIAVFTAVQTSDAAGSTFFYLTIYYAADGTAKSTTTALKTKATAAGLTHRISGSNVFFGSSQKVIFGMQFFCLHSDTTCHYKNNAYDAYIRVGMFSVASNSIDFLKRMDQIQGRAGAIAVIDNGSSQTIYVGGAANDADGVSGSQLWAPSIQKLDDSGTTQYLIKLVQDPTPSQWPHSNFPLIDHLKIDSTTMFGTTQGGDITAPGDQVYVFTLSDFNDLGTSTAVTVNMVKLGLSGAKQVTGVYPTLVSGAVHLIYHDPGNSDLFYTTVNPSTGTSASVKLFAGATSIRESLFISGGSSTSVTDSSGASHTIYQSYSVGSASSLTSTIPANASKSSGDVMGVIMASLQADTCIPLSLAADLNAGATTQSMTTDDTANEAMIDIDSNPGQEVPLVTVTSTIYDIVWSSTSGNTWCSTTSPIVATASSSCTLTAPTAHTDKSFSLGATADSQEVDVFVDPSTCSSVLYTSAISPTPSDATFFTLLQSGRGYSWGDGGQTDTGLLGTYTITVQAETCSSVTSTTTYEVMVSSCASLTVTAPSTLTVSYTVGDTASPTSIGAFTVTPSGCAYTLSHVVTGDTAPTIFTFDSSNQADLKFEVDTSDATHGINGSSTPKTYPVTISLTNSHDSTVHATTFQFNVEVTTPCSMLTVTPPTAPSDILYTIGQGSLPTTLDAYTVVPDTCTDYTVNMSSNPVLSSAFTFDNSDTSALGVTINTSDQNDGIDGTNSQKTYVITVEVVRNSDSQTVSTLNFNAILKVDCTTLAISAVPSVTSIAYTVGSGPSPESLGAYTVTPSVCAYTLSHVVTDDPGSSVFSFDSTNLTDLIFTTSTSTADHGIDGTSTPKTYTVTVSMTNSADSTVLATTYQFSVVVTTPCSLKTVTAPATPPDIAYTIGQGSLPTNIGGFAVKPDSCTDYSLNMSGDPGSGIFTFDDSNKAALQFSIDSSTPSDGIDGTSTPKTYPITVTCLDTGGSGATLATLNFNADLTDPCKSSTITLTSAIVPSDTLDYAVGNPQDSLVFVPSGNINNSYDTANAATLCSSIGYEYLLVDSSLAAIDASIFTFTSATPSLATSTSDAASVGDHNLKLGVKFAGAAYSGSEVYQDFVKTIVPGSCGSASVALPSASLDTSGNILDQEYYVGDTTELVIDLGIPTIVAEPLKSECIATASSTITASDASQTLPPLILSGDSATGFQYTLLEETDLTITTASSPYYVDFTVTLTLDSLPSATQDYSFNLRVHNPCADSVRSSISVPSDQDESYALGDTLDISTLKTDFVYLGPTICGDLTFTFTLDSAIFTVSAEETSIQVYSNDATLVGNTKQVIITAALTDYPTIEASSTITVSFTEGTTEPIIVVPEEEPEQVDETTDEESAVAETEVSVTIPEFTFDFNSVEATQTSLKGTTEIPMDGLGQQFSVVSIEVKDADSKALSAKVGSQGIIVELNEEFAETKAYEYKVVLEGYDSSGNVVKIEKTVKVNSIKRSDLSFLNNFSKDKKPEQPDLPRPSMRLAKVDQFGLVTVEFSEEFIVPPKESYYLFNSTVLDLSITAENESMKGLLKFTWKLIAFEKNQMQIQLEFENPKYVSSDNAGPDYFNFEVKKDQDFYFVSKLSGKSVLTKYTVEETDKNQAPIIYKPILINLPKQFAQEEQAAVAAMEAQAAQAGAIGSSVGISNLIINVVLSGSLALLWGLINSLQLVVHFQLMNVTIPQNAAVYYTALYELANFDVIPSDDIYGFLQEHVGTEEEGEDDEEEEVEDEVTSKLSQQTIDAGYESSNVVQNNFTLFLGLGVLVIILVFALLAWICFRKFQRVRNCVQKIKRKIFFNSFIRSFLETALESQISVMIKIYALNFTSFSEGFGSAVAILQLSLYVIFSLGIPFFLQKHQKRITRTEFKEKYGALTLGMRAKEWSVKLYQSFFILRRLILSSLIIFAVKYSWAQIMVMTFVCSIQLIYIGLTFPYITKWVNMLEIWNEYLVLLDLYFMFMYSDGLLLMQHPLYPEEDEKIPDVDAKEEAGQFNIYLLGLLVGSNLILMLAVQSQVIKFKCKRKCAQRKHKKMLEQRKEQLRLRQSEESALKNLQEDNSLVQAKHRRSKTLGHPLSNAPISLNSNRRGSFNRSRKKSDLNQNDMDNKGLENISEAPSLDEKASNQESNRVEVQKDMITNENPDQLLSMSISEMENQIQGLSLGARAKKMSRNDGNIIQARLAQKFQTQLAQLNQTKPIGIGQGMPGGSSQISAKTPAQAVADMQKDPFLSKSKQLSEMSHKLNLGIGANPQTLIDFEATKATQKADFMKKVTLPHEMAKKNLLQGSASQTQRERATSLTGPPLSLANPASKIDLMAPGKVDRIQINDKDGWKRATFESSRPRNPNQSQRRPSMLDSNNGGKPDLMAQMEEIAIKMGLQKPLNNPQNQSQKEQSKTDETQLLTQIKNQSTSLMENSRPRPSRNRLVLETLSTPDDDILLANKPNVSAVMQEQLAMLFKEDEQMQQKSKQ